MTRCNKWYRTPPHSNISSQTPKDSFRRAVSALQMRSGHFGDYKSARRTSVAGPSLNDLPAPTHPLVSVRDGITLSNRRHIIMRLLLLRHVKLRSFWPLAVRVFTLVLLLDLRLCSVHGQVVRRALLSSKIRRGRLVPGVVRLWRATIAFGPGVVDDAGWGRIR